ncbi:hypothetical protein ABEB36_010483 [Hypothenemus hampei]|uniref:Glycoprotein-N-acetylgalactosamine 3-beta-galactosyltransferase 1 n=1 Tax=Hypothenemus hampei TaxID=57062 RepID=A0ABD1ENZ9_HYPHA
MTIALRNRVFKPTPPVFYFLIGLGVGLSIGILLFLQFSDIDFSIFSLRSSEVNYEITGHNESDHDIFVNSTVARELQNEIKILCWIMTGPKTHQTKAKHVKATWGKKCNILLFMSTKEDPSLPTVVLPVIENRDNLWGKTKEAFKYVYKHYFDQADWFYKADDDTYAIPENMRYMLYFHNNSEPIYFGFRFKPIVKQGYMSGGSGYVLSKEALKRFITDSLPDPKKCKQQNTGAEDAEMGRCLESVGVKAGDSRDKQGRSTFLPLYVTSFLIPGQIPKDMWFWSYTYYPFHNDMNCCSDNLISIHYVNPNDMYLLEYLIYHVKPFGFSYNNTLAAALSNISVKTEQNKLKNITTTISKRDD